MATSVKYLIIGKHGQLAQAFTRLFTSLSIDFVAVSQNDCDATVQSDLTGAIDKSSPSVIINTSAYNLVQQAEVEPMRAFSVNCFAVSNMASICSERNIKLVSFSTDYVFDGHKREPYLESDLPHPLQMYGLSKHAGEIASFNVNSNTIMIRTNGLYGGIHGSPQKNGNFVLNILRDAHDQKSLKVSDLYTVNPTSAVELAKATLSLIEAEFEGGMYHLASEGMCTWYDFAKFIVSYKKLNCETESSSNVAKDTLKRPIYSVLGNTRAKAYGIVLPDWQTSVTDYLNEIS